MSDQMKASDFRPIARSSESTVVAEFEPDKARETAYQSEAQLEKQFIRQLESQAYAYLPITTEEELIVNLRRQLEKLNRFEFSDAEWERFFTTCVAGTNDGIKEKTARIQEDPIQLLERDSGEKRKILPALLWNAGRNNTIITITSVL